MDSKILRVEDIHTYYGLSHILHGISLELEAGEITALLGRNGAGKTTTFKSIMSMNPPKEGRIIFKGEDITGSEPHKLSKKGISFVPDNKRLFPGLSVMEHLRVPDIEGNREERLELVFDIFPKLKERADQNAMTLSGGEQQMLIVSRALMTDPELLLLDEPFEGLAPVIVKKLVDSLKDIESEGLTMLIASQNMKVCFELVEDSYIIENGRIVYEGSKNDLQENPEIIERHVGVSKK